MKSEPNVLVRRLVTSAQGNVLISLHTRRESPDTFSVGWIVGLSQEVYVLATVDELGRRDSQHVGYLKDVYRVVDGGDYLEAIGRMMMNHVKTEIPDKPEPSISEALRWAEERIDLVTILDRKGVETHGYVTEIHRDAISLHSYNKMGGDDGNIVVLLADLFRVELGGPPQQNIASLIRLGCAT